MGNKGEEENEEKRKGFDEFPYGDKAEYDFHI